MFYNALQYRKRHAPVAIYLINIGIPDTSDREYLLNSQVTRPMILLYFIYICVANKTLIFHLHVVFALITILRTRSDVAVRKRGSF